jgi:hypothetical protein
MSTDCVDVFKVTVNFWKLKNLGCCYREWQRERSAENAQEEVPLTN